MPNGLYHQAQRVPEQLFIDQHAQLVAAAQENGQLFQRQLVEGSSAVVRKRRRMAAVAFRGMPPPTAASAEPCR